jgi:hypothetical protein
MTRPNLESIHTAQWLSNRRLIDVLGSTPVHKAFLTCALVTRYAIAISIGGCYGYQNESRMGRI